MPFNALADQHRSQELPADLQERLSRVPRDEHWAGFALVDPQTLRVGVGDAPEAAGMTLQDLADRVGGCFAEELADEGVGALTVSCRSCSVSCRLLDKCTC